MPRQPLGGGGTDHAQLDAAERAKVPSVPEQALDEGVDGIGARKNNPVERAGERTGVVQRTVVVGRQNPNHRRLDRVGAHRFETLDELGRLLAWPRHQNALAEQRSRVEPSQVLPQARDTPDHQNRRPPVARLARQAQQFVDRSDMGLLRRQRPVVDDCGGVLGRAAVRQERTEDRRHLFRAGIADDRAVKSRKARPVNRSPRLALILVAADEGQRVPATGIGHRNACVARHRDARGNAGNDFEIHALLVQEQRFRTAPIENEWVAPFQTGDRLALARLFGQEITDRFLFERLRRRAADVNFLGVGPRAAQQTRVDEMIEEHDVRRLEALEPSHGDEAGIPRPGADQSKRLRPSWLNPLNRSLRAMSVGEDVARTVGEQLRADPCADRCCLVRPARAPWRRSARRPSSDTTTAISSSSSFVIGDASAPIGVWHPPPSAATTARSASSAACASGSSTAPTAAPTRSGRPFGFRSRQCLARAPAHKRDGGKVAEMRDAMPNRRNPAAARTMASKLVRAAQAAVATRACAIVCRGYRGWA